MANFRSGTLATSDGMRHGAAVESAPTPAARSGAPYASAGLTVLLALGFFAAVVSRRPSVITNAQFWAEDGSVLYVQARELGVAAFAIPYAGYPLAMQRLVASISPWLPLSMVPLVFNLAALVLQTLPAVFLASGRMRDLGPLPVRILLGVLYVGVPNVATVLGNLSNAQWHLAILCFLILVASVPRSGWAAAFDVAFLALGAFTGPFSLLLLPVAAVVAWVRRDRWTLARAAIVGLGAVTLPFAMAGSMRPKSIGGLGASVTAFCQLLTFQVFVPVFRGINNSVQFLHPPSLLPTLSYVATAVGLTALAYVFVRGGLEVRCFLMFATMLLAASLANPAASAVEPQWVALQKRGSPPRYWFVPELAVTAAVVSLACTAGHRVLRAIGAALVVVMLVVDISYWRLPALPDRGFAHYVAAFEKLPVGQQMRIAIPPNWTFSITKTARD